MVSLKVVLYSLLVVVAICDQDLDFPEGFLFGAASAAYQVEGGWNANDKGESIWDWFAHERSDLINNGSTGDVACDSYHLWKRDVEMASELGLHFYRFSISWPRLLPNGFYNNVSKDGVNYYNNLIDGLLEKGIQPMVTLYQFDLPQRLQNWGGWANPLIMDWFGDYARVAFSVFGDRVKTWITVNEPIMMCDLIYNSGTFAPGILDYVATYQCNKNVLMAHAKAWRIYDEEFKPLYHGEVALVNQLIWFEAATPEDEELTELGRVYVAGKYSDPIYSKEGGWPPVIEEIMAEISKKNGYSRSILPAFTKEEQEFVKGTYDFLGLNYYTARLVRKAKDGEVLDAFPAGDLPDIDAKLAVSPYWGTTSSSTIYVYPEGLRNQLIWLKKHYGDIKFIITENGYVDEGGLDDPKRIEYYTEHLKQLLLAIKEDGVNVTAFTAWALMDNFEWLDGYHSKYGLYEVDFSSSEKTRTPKASAAFYKTLIERNSLHFD